MDYKEISNKLKEIKTENFIWIIYIGIIIFSFYSNSLETKYYLYNDLKSKEKYRETLIIIFSILLLVYLYFLKSAYDDLKSIKPCDNMKKKQLTNLAFISSLLITISGILFLYIAFNDQSIDVELAFN